VERLQLCHQGWPRHRRVRALARRRRRAAWSRGRPLGDGPRARGGIDVNGVFENGATVTGASSRGRQIPYGSRLASCWRRRIYLTIPVWSRRPLPGSNRTHPHHRGHLLRTARAVGRCSLLSNFSSGGVSRSRRCGQRPHTDGRLLFRPLQDRRQPREQRRNRM